MDILGWTFGALAIAGSAYTGLAIIFVLRFFRAGPELGAAAHRPPATLLKPLHGDEPGLRRNLESFFDQAIGDVEIVFGVQDPSDPAIAVIEALAALYPTVAVRLSLDGERRGQNAKVSNLIAMQARARGEVLVISDSDIAAPPDYLAAVLAALQAPGVGVVTCPYVGRGETGFWSDIAAMGLSHHFMPNVITGVTLGMARPCMGSTIALRRETLERVGGFEAFRDVLADDYLLGAAVRALGLRSVVAPLLVTHSCAETNARDVVSHELRWARTVKGLDFPGHLGSLVTHPFPLALVAAALLGFTPAAVSLLAVALAARLGLAAAANHVAGRPAGALWMLPMRDVLSFGVFVGSFFGRAVVWRGQAFHVTTNGDLIPVQRP